MWNGRPLLMAAILGMALPMAGTAEALMVPFTESFDSDVADWGDADSNPLTFVATGGADGGGFARGQFNFLGFVNPFGGGPVTHRAQDEFGDDGSSDGAFIGNYFGTVNKVRLFFRHDAPVALTPFLRLATTSNFPGSVIDGTIAVEPNVWTPLEFDVQPGNPLCVGEGVSCADVVPIVGHLQFGTDAPDELVVLDQDIDLDIDRVSLVPEPGVALLLGVGLLGLSAYRRH